MESAQHLFRPRIPKRFRAIPALFRELFLCIAIGLAVYSAIAAYRPHNLVVRFAPLYDTEDTSTEPYRWAPSQIQLYVPFEQVTPSVIVRQRLTAGPTPADARPLSIQSAGSATTFRLEGGVPARVYRYLLPTNGH